MSDLFSKNYFEIFNLPVQFEVDLSALNGKYRELQKEVHPDKFVSAGEQQSRLAVQITSLVNQAFETLKSPVSRAQYLLKVAGLDIDHEQETTIDPMFLMDQMELREEIEALPADKDALNKADRILKDIKSRLADVMSAFNQAYQNKDFAKAQEWSRKLQFLHKNTQELDEIVVTIEDELLS